MHVELDVLDPIDAEKRTEERLALYPGQCEPEYPYIPTAKTSDFDSLLDGAQQFLASLREVDFKRLGERAEKALAGVDTLVSGKADPMIDEAKAFLVEIRESNRRLQEILARKEIDETIQNIGVITTDVRTFVDGSKGDLAKAIAELPATIAAVEGAATRLEQLVDSEPVRESLRNIEAASKELKPLIGEYKALGEDLGDLVASEEADIRRLIASLRQLVQNLESFSGRLRQDPPHVLFGPAPAKLPPGEPAK
jgi:ABC-type transporter Mla subunit MlaD